MEVENTQLTDAAGNDDLSSVIRLLDGGVDINSRHCLGGCRYTALMNAAVKGHLEVVEALLERGADPMLLNDDKKTAAEMARESGKPEVADFISEYGQRQNPDKVVFFDKIGDRVRQDIYDFTMRERVTFIRTAKYAPVETTTITGFSLIEDQSDESMLRKAFNEHRSRGGKVDESVIFPNRIIKSCVLKP